jgi:fumarate reductase flavoprotein subunit
MAAATRMHCDVLIVGAGGTGLTTAAALASWAPGLRVLLLDRDLATPCNTAIASNFIPAAGTRFQRAAGIEDSPDLLLEDILRKNGGSVDLTLARAICEASAVTLHWLVDIVGVELEFAPELTWLGHSLPRMHAHPERGGPPVLESLRRFVIGCPGVEVLDRTVGVDLIGDAVSGVRGARARRGDQELDIRASRVVLACGGFGARADRVAAYIPEMAGAPHIGSSKDLGDALDWGEALGAAFARLGAYQGRDCIFADGTRVTPPVLNQGGIAVNATGRRFVNELEDYSRLARVYRRQPGGVAFFIWDQRIQDQVAGVLVMRQAMARGGIERAADAVALARVFGLPASEIEQTLADWAALPAGQSDQFGRSAPAQGLRAPYYAARITGAVAHTQGGLVVDACGRVLRPDGQVIGGLHAGGNAIAGLSGGDCTGYLSGNGLLVAYASGYLIGRTIAADLRADRGVVSLSGR